MLFQYNNNLNIAEVWKMVDNIKKTANLENTVLDTFRLLFLKYAEDNYNDGASVSWADANEIRELFEKIDKIFQLDDILGAEKNVGAYGQIFLERGAVNTKLYNMMAAENLQESGEIHLKGMAIVDVFTQIFESREGRVTFQNEFGTRDSVSHIAREILDVKSWETFLDFAAGTGFSTLVINKDKTPCPNIVNIDADPEMSAMEAMLFIMYGYRNFKVINGDGIRDLEIPGVDKVFVDGPRGRFSNAMDDEYGNITMAIIRKIRRCYLGNGARAVVTVPGQFLFSNAAQPKELRRELVDGGELEAVYSLPETHILVMGQTPQEGIRFVNLLEEKMEVIKEPRQVAQNNYSIIPEDYVFKSPEYNMTREDIDKALHEKYRQLAQLSK